MGKAPAFQFYVGDWMQDTRPLSLSAKGAWIDLLCAMWRSQSRGTLTLPIVGYARLIGASVEQTKTVIDELIEMRICDSETDGNGNVTLINRRMIREQKERESTRLRVEKFRNATEKRVSNGNVTVPSSSSSSPSCTEVQLKADIAPKSAPSIEEQNQTTIEIAEVADKLYKQKLFSKVVVFINTCRKKKIEEETILLALKQFIRYRPRGDPWAYCCQIVGIENGNIREGKAIEEHEKRKREEREYTRTDRSTDHDTS